MNLTFVLIVLALFVFWQIKIRYQRRKKYIRNYFFHKGIRKKLADKYPFLDDQQQSLIFQALKDYFLLCLLANKRMVAMPSQAVDVAWHEFILSTRFYHQFCQKAFGRYLHHTPTEAMLAPTVAQQGIKRAWRLSCALEKINPKQPERLPLLFALDSLLNIPDGFVYQLNCLEPSSDKPNGYCVTHIGCASGCSGDSGVSGLLDGFSSDGDSSCGSDCGGGCGGD